MNIFGIGTDIVSVERVKKSIKNKNFLKRLFNEKEIAKCNGISNSSKLLCQAFCSKRGFSKALGTGISNGINFNEIVILNKNLENLI